MKRISLWFILSIMAVFALTACNIQSVDEYQKQEENETAVSDDSEVLETKTISEEASKEKENEKQKIETESEESSKNKEIQPLVDTGNKEKKVEEEKSISTKTETASKTDDNKNQAENQKSESKNVTKNQPKDEPATSSEKVSEKKSEKQETPKTKETKSTKNQEKSKVVEKPKAEKPKIEIPKSSKKKYVTITIRVDTILDNMDSLDPSLKSEKYVPRNGVILKTKKYELKENKEENVFDILVRATNEHRIQMEYQGASENQYGSVYIEGINHLYEFSVGELSGWMYSVNGWYPNYGASKYKLKDGDKIEWNYTCDLGRDLGVTWLE